MMIQFGNGFAIRVGRVTFRADWYGVTLIRDEGPGETPVFAWVRPA